MEFGPAKAALNEIMEHPTPSVGCLDSILRQGTSVSLHGVVSPGASTPEPLLDQAGDYAAFQSLPLGHHESQNEVTVGGTS